MQHRVFESGVGGMTMCFPVAVRQIEFNASANRFASIETNGRVAEIRSGLTVPHPELHNVDLVAAGADELVTEIAREPARLQLQFARNFFRREECALAHARHLAHFGIAISDVHGGENGSRLAARSATPMSAKNAGENPAATGRRIRLARVVFLRSSVRVDSGVRANPPRSVGRSRPGDARTGRDISDLCPRPGR